METGTYLPKILADDVDFDAPDEVKALDASLTEYGLTHVKDKSGRVWKVLGKLNRKSVPLNNAGDGPQRINFTSVSSFGVMSPPGPTDYAKAVEAGDTVAAEEAAQQAREDKANLLASVHATRLAEEPAPAPEPAPAAAADQEPTPATPGAERDHAVLSASGAHRWLNCPPSALLEDEADDTAGAAAEEGTAAHALGEHKIRRALKLRSQRPTSTYEDDAMGDYTDNYATYVLDRWEQAVAEDPGAVINIEQRLDFSTWVPGGFGTGDCLIASGDKLTVIDFKYGAGVIVDAYENPQMKLYALGALDALGFMFDFHDVEMVIYQPRRDNISSFTLTVDELTEWATETVAPRAKLAAKGEGQFNPGEWCQFCNIKATCRARAEKNLEIAQWEFEDPTELTDEELAEALRLAPMAKKWIADLERWATDQALNQNHVLPGFKLVAGRSVRTYIDPDEVAAAAEQAGYTDIWDKKLLTLTKMEKLMGKAEFKQVLGHLVHKPEGKPTLVPQDDKRPAITARDAVSEFTD